VTYSSFFWCCTNTKIRGTFFILLYSLAQKLHSEAREFASAGDYENALKHYQLTDKIEPKGFYTSKTALHTLEREISGDLAKGIYKAYVSLESVGNEAEKLEMIKLLIEKFPDFAPGWKEYSNTLEGKVILFTPFFSPQCGQKSPHVHCCKKYNS
jgi:hypothetical protein